MSVEFSGQAQYSFQLTAALATAQQTNVSFTGQGLGW